MTPCCNSDMRLNFKKGFRLMFSGGLERDQWHEIVLGNVM